VGHELQLQDADLDINEPEPSEETQEDEIQEGSESQWQDANSDPPDPPARGQFIIFVHPYPVMHSLEGWHLKLDRSFVRDLIRKSPEADWVDAIDLIRDLGARFSADPSPGAIRIAVANGETTTLLREIKTALDELIVQYRARKLAAAERAAAAEQMAAVRQINAGHFIPAPAAVHVVDYVDRNVDTTFDMARHALSTGIMVGAGVIGAIGACPVASVAAITLTASTIVAAAVSPEGTGAAVGRIESLIDDMNSAWTDSSTRRHLSSVATAAATTAVISLATALHSPLIFNAVAATAAAVTAATNVVVRMRRRRILAAQRRGEGAIAAAEADRRRREFPRADRDEAPKRARRE